MADLTLMDFIKGAKSKIKEVSTEEASRLLQEDGFRVLDIREGFEYDAGTIKGALHVPRGTLEMAADFNYPEPVEELRDNRDAKWVLLCRSGGRSALAADTLQQMGFKTVINILGGFNAWKKENRDITIP